MNQRPAIYIKTPTPQPQRCQEKRVGFLQWSARKEEGSVATSVMLKKKTGELCLEIPVMIFNLARVFVSKTVS